MKWLCKIWIHSWESIGFTNLLCSDELKVCRRCGSGKHSISFGQATMYYTAGQVMELRRLAQNKFSV